MFGNLRKKAKKKFNWKKNQSLFFGCPSFVFALYILISPNLQILLEKITYQGRSQRGAIFLKIARNLIENPRNWTMTTLASLSALVCIALNHIYTHLEYKNITKT